MIEDAHWWDLTFEERQPSIEEDLGIFQDNALLYTAIAVIIGHSVTSEQSNIEYRLHWLCWVESESIFQLLFVE